jgi:peptide/nickel transport system substrate-binding protein
MAGAGCSSSGTKKSSSPPSGSAGALGATGVPDPNGTVSFAQAATFGMTFDPHMWANGLTYWGSFTLLYDRLIQLTPDSKNLAPMLATSWQWNPSNTQLTMNLRKDVTFQDGTQFNAAAAVQNLMAAAAATANSKAELETMTSVVAVDPHTIKLTFSEPDPSVLFDLTGYAGMMVSPNGLANPSALKTQPMGSGPYQLASTTASLTLNFLRWDGYWNKSHVYPLHYQIVNIANETTRFNAIDTGTTASGYITALTLPTALANKSLQVVQEPAFVVYVLFLNTKIAPLNNLQVRQAISMTLDRDAFNKSQDNTCPVTYQSIPPGMVGHVNSFTVPTDTVKAKEMVQAAGAAGATIRMVDPAIEPFATFTRLIQAQLGAIGLNIAIVPSPSNRTLYSQGSYGMEFATTAIAAPDPSQIFDEYVTGSGNPGTTDPTLVAEISKAEQLSLGSAERAHAFETINTDISSKYLPFVPVCQQVNIFVGNNEVLGLNAMPNEALSAAPDDSYLQIAK